MAKRIKTRDFRVDDPDAAMARFKVGLRKLVQVPKSEIKAKPKRKAAPKRKA
jgi:hypothetical protein